MGVALQFTITFQNTGECPTCGVPVILTDNHERRLRESKATFYCPNGHPQSFKTGELDRLKKELESAKRDADWQRQRREQEERSHAATRGQMTKLKNRVTNGVCPCCNRTFKNLQRHMQSKHPEAVEKGRDV